MAFSFGAQPQNKGFSFGAPSSTTATPSAPTSLFGSNPSAATATAPTGGFSFGNTSQPAAPTAPTGGFSFGNTQQNTTSTAPAGGFSFGATPSTATTSNAAPSSSFSFETTPAPQTTASSAPTGGFSFGGSSTGAQHTTSLFGMNKPTPQQQQPQPVQLDPSLMQGPPDYLKMIHDIIHAFAPNSDRCRFKTMVYNKSDVPIDLSRVQRPNGVSENAWQLAISNNPDPRTYYLAIASTQRLQQRLVAQQEQAKKQTDKLNELAQRINALSQKHALQDIVRLEEYRKRHRDAIFRLLAIMKWIQGMDARGSPLYMEEETLRAKLEQLSRLLHKPGVFLSKAKEMKALLDAAKEAKQHHAARRKESAYLRGNTSTSLDEQKQQQLFETLNDMQTGINVLTSILKEDTIKLQGVLRQY